MQEHEEVLLFWFEQLEPKQHFKKDARVDAEIFRRYSGLHQRAAAGDLVEWRSSTRGRLAEIIVLDQFSRNLYRNSARAWAQDSLALSLATDMVALQLDLALESAQRVFVYLPFMHSEAIQAQRESVRLFTSLGRDSNLKFAVLHHNVIEKFGRFPYRNEHLDRQSSPAEIEYVARYGSF